MIWVEGAEIQYNQDPYSPGWQPVNGRIITVAEFLFKNKSSEPTLSASVQGYCTGEMSPQNVWFWRLPGLLSGDSETWKKRTLYS